MKPAQSGGLFLLAVGVVLILLGIRLPALSYCIGVKVLGVCVGKQFNYSYYLWGGIAVLGLLVTAAGGV